VMLQGEEALDLQCLDSGLQELQMDDSFNSLHFVQSSQVWFSLVREWRGRD
jgi:hypothetical protein